MGAKIFVNEHALEGDPGCVEGKEHSWEYRNRASEGRGYECFYCRQCNTGKQDGVFMKYTIDTSELEEKLQA